MLVFVIRSGLVAGVGGYKCELALALLVSVKVQECNLVEGTHKPTGRQA